jgi:hypothetical protein
MGQRRAAKVRESGWFSGTPVILSAALVQGSAAMANPEKIEAPNASEKKPASGVSPETLKKLGSTAISGTKK